MQYYKKYDPDNGGTQYVFNKLYGILANDYGVRSNMIACCGEDGLRYEKYAEMLSTNKAKAYFIENSYERFGMLYDLIRNRKNIKVIHGDVFKYLGNPSYRAKRPCRVEDLGLGIGFKELACNAAVLLGRQQKFCHYHAWKAQILDGSIRQVTKHKVWDTLQAYLNTIDLKIKTVNHSTNPKVLEVNPDNYVHKYIDRTGKTGKVYEFKVELFPNTHQASLYIYSCLNGSPMMQTMLVYK